MKILVFNYEYPPLGGGGGVATKQLLAELGQRHEVHVVTTWFKGLPIFEQQSGVTVHRVRVIGRKYLPTASIISMITFVPMAVWRGWCLSRQYQFDVINAQFVVPSGLPAVILHWLTQVPFVLSFIGGDIYDPTKGVSPHRHGILRALIRLIARQASVCTAISEDTKRRAQRLHGVTTPIVVTPIGLVRQTVPSVSREELGLPKHVPLFVSIGRLISRKGFENLVRAWREIYTAHLVIIGDGPLYQKLKHIIKEYQLEERVHLLGFVPEERKQQILRVADAYISAAEHEGFGIVFLEAMEAGLPIIATDNGGQTDFLVAGENAILIPPEDVHQVSSAIAWLLKDGRLREAMSRNNKQKVQEYYINKTTAQFEQLLEQYARRS